MAKIVLTTLNARYIHSSLGLRYLYANMGELQEETKLLEFSINQNTAELVDELLAQEPVLIGFGVYIWNSPQTLELIRMIKECRPDIIIVCGGPEVSFYPDGHPLIEISDHIVRGEADLSFSKLCNNLLVHQTSVDKIIVSQLPEVSKLQMPYAYYNDDDIKNRVVYVEASRGCPFKCEFCLSSLDKKVRNFPLEDFLEELAVLFEKGVRHFKFVDRTFNLHIETSTKILQFFLDRYEPGLFVHFELIPDRLPQGLRALIQKFPIGALQFEIGIQTFNLKSETLISRRQDQDKTVSNLMFLRDETGVYLHTDLIVGLPGETLESFAQGFDRLVALNPHEIQVGILKRLPGTPIARHDIAFDMHYNENPPYEILFNQDLTKENVDLFKAFAYFWDRISNSGNFRLSKELLWQNASPFWSFWNYSIWLQEHFGRAHSISLEELVSAKLSYLSSVKNQDKATVGKTLLADYTRIGRKPPNLLKPFATHHQSPTKAIEWVHPMPRQNRHLVS